MKQGTQRAMHCRCGNPRILAVGLCETCYTLKRQDEEYFEGLREAVLKRDGHRCPRVWQTGRPEAKSCRSSFGLPASQSWT